MYDGPSLPLYESVGSLAVPVYFFEGRRDYVSPTACAERLFAALSAPSKTWVWFDDSAHFPFLDEPEHFHQALLVVASQTALHGKEAG